MAAIKFSKQYIEPNPNEIDYWVDLSSNQYGGRMKYYNGFEWVDLVNPDGTHIDINDFYNKLQINQMLSQKASVDSVESKVDDDEVSDVIKNISFSQRGEDGVEMVMFKYDDTTVGIQLPIADNTKSGIITKDTFKNLVNQTQLQQLYSEMYTKLSEIRNNYQPKLRAGANIKIENNVISAVSKISTDWNDIANKPDIYDKSQVDTMMSGVYKIKGSRRFEALPLYANTVGDTYNITNDFSLHGEDYPLGTNVVWTENGWDALAGIFDTSELEENIQEVKDNYLPLTGGIINGTTSLYKDGATPLTITTNLSNASIAFKNNSTSAYAYLTCGPTGFAVTDAGWKSLYKIWHEGNDGAGSGLDADTLDGYHLNSIFANHLWQSSLDGNERLFGAYLIGGAESINLPSTSGLLIAFNGIDGEYKGGQLFFHPNGKVDKRTHWNGKWSPWKTIAFTDSDITGNAATTTKLATPVKLWGNDFDGSSDVNSGIVINLNGYISTSSTDVFTDTSGTKRPWYGLSFNTTGTTNQERVMLASYFGMTFKAHSTKPFIFDGGPVGIGTNYPQYKLEVNGSAAINDYTIFKDSVSIWNSLAVSNKIISGELVDWYGVSWSEDSSDPTCTRIGNMALHRSLPIQSAMQGYLILRPIDFILPLTSNWEKSKYDGAHNNGANISAYSNSNVMVKIPEFWYTDDYEPSTKTHNLKISQTAKAGWCHHKEAYVGAYEGCINEGQYKSIKGKIPTVSVNRETIRTAARANGYEDEYKWNIYTYEEHRAICHLFLVEYATRNSQAPVNTTLTADGFKQGGLGSGCTTGSVTINGQVTYSFIPTGTTDSLGNGSGQVAYTVTQTDADGNEIGNVTRYANRYRGIENPFGHIWKHVDDVVNVYNAETTYKTVYKCNKPEHFATNKNAKYKPLCSFPGGSKMVGWSKEIKATINCDFFKYSVDGSESTYWCDYNYDNDDTSEHCLLTGGLSGNGSKAGLFYFYLNAGVGYSVVNLGSRLTYLPWAE